MEEEIKEGNPLKWILGIFLVLVVLALIFPYYAVKLDPEPKYIASLDEVSSLDFEILDEASQVDSHYDFLGFVNGNDPIIKGIADRVVSSAGCDGDKTCYAKALFAFVKQEIEYVNDPPDEYVKSARETLLNGAGDCDDFSVLLVNLLEAIGTETRFVFVPGHVYVEAYLPEALGRYQKDGWVSMDATCQYCEFGEISYKSNVEKVYV